MGCQPSVSVLMSVYNGEKHLEEAVESILAQTFRDFEFIIIDDGSTDSTGTILSRFQKIDPRVLVHRQENQGLIASLNTGCSLSKGKFIARMDADDISLPERLEKQVEFMEVHPGVGVQGTWVRTIGDNGGDIWDYPSDDATIRSTLLFASALAHPSAMIRGELVGDGHLVYDPMYAHAEDYELWVRLTKQTALANFPEVLLLHRLHPSQIGRRHESEQQSAADRIRLAQLEWLGLEPSPDEFEVHRALSLWRFRVSREFISRADEWLRRLKTANQERRIYPEPEFSQVLVRRWLAACQSGSASGLWAWRRFRQSPLSRPLGLSWRQRLAFQLACARHEIEGRK